MSTNLLGFNSFSFFLHDFVLAKLASISIRVKSELHAVTVGVRDSIGGT